MATPSPVSAEPGVFAPAGSLSFDPWELVTSLEWSPGGRYLVAAAGGSLVWVDGESQAIATTVDLGPLTHGLAFSPDGETLAAASHDGQVRLWSTGQAGLAGDPLAWPAHKKGANQAAFSADGRYLATGGNDAMVRIWDLQSGEVVQEIIGGTFAVPGLSVDGNGESLYIVNGNLVRVREVAGGRMSASLRTPEDANLFSLSLSPGGTMAAAGDAQGRVWLWTLPAGGEVEADRRFEAETPAQIGLVWSLDFNPDGSLLAASYADGHLRIWDTAAGTLLADIDAHQGAAAAVRFSPDGSRAASGGLDGLLHFWAVNPP